VEADVHLLDGALLRADVGSQVQLVRGTGTLLHRSQIDTTTFFKVHTIQFGQSRFRQACFVQGEFKKKDKQQSSTANVRSLANKIQ
jgi:hypothetical protein